MNNAEQILVVMLSGALALNLLLTLVLLVLLIKIVKRVKDLTEKAAHLANKAEAVGDFFQHAAGPLALSRVIALVSSTIFRTREKTKKRRG